MVYKKDPKLIRQVLGNKIQFILGDVGFVYGAILAGCSFFGGYPITPATEIAEEMSKILPKIGGTYIQMEDEIGSIASVIGASWGGSKSMTATSSPGFSLMMENYGFAVMTETPCVIVNVQRSGPSTGQPTLGAQGDIMQSRWGTHGDIEAIVLAPSNVQECVDLTIEAFNLSEKYRHPVCIMADGEVGYFREKIEIPDEKDLKLIDRKTPAKNQRYQEFRPTEKGSNIPFFPTFGNGYRSYVTGLTHDKCGLPSTFNRKDHEDLILRISKKITDNREKLTNVERLNLEDANIAFVAYGATSRAAEYAINMGRQKGLKVGLLKLKTIWPFPIKEIQNISSQVDKIIVPEMNLGQIVHPVKEYSEGNCEVVLATKIGGEMHHPIELYDYLEG